MMLSVVDKNGEILAKFAKREDAEDWARSRGMAVMAGDTVLSGQVAQDSELPGMWSASDLAGGEADTQDEVARFAPFKNGRTPPHLRCVVDRWHGRCELRDLELGDSEFGGE